MIFFIKIFLNMENNLESHNQMRKALGVSNANSQHKKRVAKAQQVRQRGGQRRGCHWWPQLHRSGLSSPKPESQWQGRTLYLD